MPSGFILTILSCQKFSQNNRDDLAFKNTAEAIKTTLNASFTCYRPTVPTNEELLMNYSKDTVLKELGDLINNAQKALDSDCEKEASEYWRNVFGDRFPLGKEKDDNSTKSTNTQTTRTKVSAPWSLL